MRVGGGFLLRCIGLQESDSITAHAGFTKGELDCVRRLKFVEARKWTLQSYVITRVADGAISGGQWVYGM
jgi:hypothetical protein